MNYTIRSADKRDYQGLIELFKSNPKTFMGYSDDNLLSEMLDTIPEILENPLYFTVLTVVDQEIIGCIVLKEFENQPCWTYGYWNMKPGMLTKLWFNDGFKMMRTISDQMFDEMETKRKLTRWFWAMPNYTDEIGIKKAGSMERWIGSNVGIRFMPRMRNYVYFDDCVIPAGTQTRYPYQRAIVGNKTWPIEIKIRMGILETSKEKIDVG